MEEEKTEETPRGRIVVKAVVTRKDGTVEDLGVVSEGSISLDAATE